MKFKKFFSFAMCAVMVLSLAACGINKPTNSNDAGERIPDPFTEYQTLEESITFRKAGGDGDISGDYNDYAQVETVDGVTLKGENGKFALAVWNRDGYTYAVSVYEPVSQADMLALTAEVR